MFDDLSQDGGPQDVSLIIDIENPNDNSVDKLTTEKLFELNERNKLLQQKEKLPYVPARISFIMTGSGCALIQVCHFTIIMK